MGIMRRAFFHSVALVVAAIFCGPAFGQSVDDFYRGKSITLVVSADAGTLTDTLVRQFAPYFVKYLPGQPDAIVMNVAGAGGMVAAASLQTKQPDDGTVVGFLQRNNLYTSLLAPSQSSFDPREVRWLGSLDKVSYALVAMSRSGVLSADDLSKKKLIIGATGFSNENRILPALLNDYAGTKLNIVPGYTGRGEVYLAMQRGEVDGWASTIEGLEKGEPAKMLAEGKMRVLLNMGWNSHSDYADVPNLSDVVTEPDVKALFDFFLSPFEAGRPVAVPRGVPEDRLDALRKAFSKAVADPGFIAAMADLGAPVDPIDGHSVELIVKKLYATPDGVLEKARQARNSSPF
ncbi:Bug family tripartite tricarboxylate transporter substrate binding protein [Marinobacter bohaiensis]|uniref:Bug family tripartite tricarboxylate transporter substrate binding protein n=1 Tax=Marinobacter bohaiensis TaxID=2201898 RepID=UPI000DAB544B|nr:tripartite tricarboxylate transporter substrate-binding protein [Marinobacter bohaiensis]